MKFNFKAVVAAAALAITGSAFASINVGSDPDLLFVAYDFNGSGATYVRDLGALSQIGENNVTFNAPAGSIFSSQFAGIDGSNIVWGVYALYKDPTSNASIVYQTNDVASQMAWDDTRVNNIAGGLTSELGSLTQLDLASNGYAKPNGEYTGANDTTNQTNGVKLINNFSFGRPLGTNGVGHSQNFIQVYQNTDNGSADATQLYLNAALTKFAPGNQAGGYFTLLDAQGDVSWTGAASVAAVPVPAAALLFFPGLLAMVGVGRRRKAA